MKNLLRFHRLALLFLLTGIGGWQQASHPPSRESEPNPPPIVKVVTPPPWHRMDHRWKGFTWSCEAPTSWNWATSKTEDDSWVEFGPNKLLRAFPLSASVSAESHLAERRQHQEGSYFDLHAEIVSGSDGKKRWVYQRPSRAPTPSIEGVVEVGEHSLLLWGLGFTTEDLPSFLRVLRSVETTSGK